MDRSLRVSHVRACAGIFATVLTLLLSASSRAVAATPTGDFAVFTQCPRFVSKVTLCLYSTSTGGTVKLGSSNIALAKPVVLQGGLMKEEEGEAFVGAVNGETLSKSSQVVSGGLLGLISSQSLPSSLRTVFQQDVNRGLTTVVAITELAKPASTIGISRLNLIFEEGIALTLPVKVHLENPFLGSQCYLGSSSNPIVLNLTTGVTSPPAPNKPIRGTAGWLGFEDEVSIATLTGQALVDNAFSAPPASGCGGASASLVDAILDSKIGLPSAAGHNTFIQDGNLVEATAVGVIESEA